MFALGLIYKLHKYLIFLQFKRFLRVLLVSQMDHNQLLTVSLLCQVAQQGIIGDVEDLILGHLVLFALVVRSLEDRIFEHDFGDSSPLVQGKQLRVERRLFFHEVAAVHDIGEDLVKFLLGIFAERVHQRYHVLTKFRVAQNLAP